MGELCFYFPKHKTKGKKTEKIKLKTKEKEKCIRRKQRNMK